jgi:hypothetical protein
VSGRPWFKTGALGWVLVGGVVLAWDLTAPETLSDAFRRARGNPAGAAAVALSWGVVTAHLYGKLPKAADPLHAIRVARNWEISHHLLREDGSGVTETAA